MKPVDNWRTVLRRAWSIRLNLGAALLSAVDAGWQVYTTGQPPIIAIITLGISLSAAVARLVAQKDVSDAR